MKTTQIMLLAVLTILIMLFPVSAFGVSAPCWEGNPLKMYPGETKTISLNVQNFVGTEDVTASIKIIEGSEISSLEQEQYIVKASSSQDVPLTIKLPSDTAIGTSTRFKVEVKTITPSVSGGIGIGTGSFVTCDVVAVEKEKEAKPLNWALYLIAGIAILILVIILLKRKR